MSGTPLLYLDNPESFHYVWSVQNITITSGPSRIILHYLWSIRKSFHHFWFVQNLFIISGLSIIISSSMFHPKHFNYIWSIWNILSSLVRPQNVILSGPSRICYLLWSVQSISFSLASSKTFHFLWHLFVPFSLASLLHSSREPISFQVLPNDHWGKIQTHR